MFVHWNWNTSGSCTNSVFTNTQTKGTAEEFWSFEMAKSMFRLKSQRNAVRTWNRFARKFLKLPWVEDVCHILGQHFLHSDVRDLSIKTGNVTVLYLLQPKMIQLLTEQKGNYVLFLFFPLYYIVINLDTL